ncbi:MAG: serine hydrolase, partial [Catalinimonas sp.]
MRNLCLLCGWLLIGSLAAQDPYFPPLAGDAWETTDPAALGWRADSIEALYDFLEARNTRAFVVLKGGRIVLERYFGEHERDDFWYWASAGKVLTAFLTGQAQEQGLLSVEDSTSHHLGVGWTDASPAREGRIRVIHQLTMTTGLDDRAGNFECTDDTCLTYLAAPGERWSYHNAPYTLLTEVLEAATDLSYNTLFRTNVRDRLGMRGLWIDSGYNRIYWSDARSAARFGLMMLRNGVWSGDTLMRDTTYFNRMIRTSQALNPSYGYLWWLNGQSSHMIPQAQFTFPGAIIPSAPADLVAGLGSNDQKLHVVPSQDLVVVRMGAAADALPPLAASSFDDDMWRRLGTLGGAPTS